MTRPPEMASRSEKRMSRGTIIIMATMRGRARKVGGSKPITSRASTSSRTIMVPISAAKALPERPATSTAVMMGPSSRTMARATRSAT